MSFNLQAQELVNKPVYCGPINGLLSKLSGTYDEKLYWIGKSESEDSKFALLVNNKTKTWTIVQFNGSVACVLGSGIDFKNFFGIDV